MSDTSAQQTGGSGGGLALALTAVGVVVALVVAFTAVIMASGDDAEVAAGAGAGGVETFDITLTEFAVDPPTIEVPAGTEVIVNVTNDGTMAHDLKINGEVGTEMLDPGATVEGVSLGVIDAATSAWCTVPGHREAGMEMTITLPGTPLAPADAAMATDDGAVIDPEATPEADWEPFDPTLAPARGATEHEITLHAVEAEVEVAPGVTQQAWTFVEGDGADQGEPRMGGPILRGHVGDLFTVTLVNDGEVGHSIDFHASRVAWNDEMRTIEPGESLVYQYRAEYAGAFMYHCGTRPPCTTSATACTAPSSSTRRSWRRSTTSSSWSSPSSTSGPRASPATSTQMVERGLRRRGLQRLLEPVQVPPDPGRGRRADPGLGARRRAVGELRLPHRRHDLRHGLEGGHVPPPARRPSGRVPGPGPAARPGRVRRVQLRRRRASTRW